MKQKYYSLKPLLKAAPDAQYYMLLGERSNGKSYQCKEYVLKRYKETGERFIYLRRYQVEAKISYVEGYFRDAPVSQIFDKWEFITAWRGGIYLARNNEETGKVERGDLIGYIGHLSGEGHFKSQNYNDVTTILFEEFISREGYLFREHELLESYVSTVARRRAIRVFLVGNTISRLCVYFSEWGLSFIPKMQQGEVRICEHKTDQTNEDGSPVIVKIAVQFCENSGNNSKMFFGTSSSMTTTGAWQTREYPHLPYKYRECKSVYTVMYQYKEFAFKLELLKTPKREYIVFVHPHNDINYDYASNGEIPPRTVSEIYDPSPLFTRELRPVLKGDKIILQLWKDGKFYYSDNLTGSDIESIVNDKGGL